MAKKQGGEQGRRKKIKSILIDKKKANEHENEESEEKLY